jgi:hypothetical protein
MIEVRMKGRWKWVIYAEVRCINLIDIVEVSLVE